MTDSENECMVCGGDLEKGGLDGNWRVFTCPDCGSEKLRPVASDHGEGFSMENLETMASYDGPDS
jgi:predicted RNA-binding Zn-ribbon protein involved in translation (DUF1610 family)